MSQALRYALIVSLGGFVFGFDASVISGVVGFVAIEFGLDAFEQGMVVSAPTLGAIIASFLAGPMADRYGRRTILQLIAALYVVSAICSAFATSYNTLVFARFIGGLAFASLHIAPMYIAEVSPAKIRGRMVSINQLNIMLGFSAAYFANYLILQLSGNDAGLAVALGIDAHTWRWMLGMEVLPALMFLLLLFAIPESPRWLLLNGRETEARSIFARILPAKDVKAEIACIQESVAQGRVSVVKALGRLFSKPMRLVLVLGLIVGISQQITGINAVYFYAPTIFEQSGVGTDAAFAQAIWVGIINIVFTVLAMVLIDRVGRKPLMLAGLAGVAISMTICAGSFHQATYQLPKDNEQQVQEIVGSGALDSMAGVSYENDVAFKNALQESLTHEEFLTHQSALMQMAIEVDARMVLIGILGFVASFAFSLGPVMWVLLSEIFPNTIRGVAISCIGVANSAVSYSIQLVFPWELAHLGIVTTFAIYGGFALVGFVLVAWLLPETKGKTLEDLEKHLGGKSQSFDEPALQLKPTA
ncbi:MFS transporter [Microbulbifer agarilyticus]|uniref:MFS transporter n=1 Tax=Microbulbifer agarilyticus TaxID=260552 RepID=A0A1Q2M0U9_9GAMM|nr:sugar porter family MFS transporter [Microbulbifer agarilyticus]AQQ66330.1 MFS transporter [Microbulbifer agarilyticus]